MKSLQEIAHFLRDKNEILRPLSTSVIDEIEHKFNVSLPYIYRQFLQLMGGGAGKYMLGSSVFYDELLSLRNWTNELIQENNLTPLPENSFVFWMHQGYQTAYFKTNEGDNPPIYFFSEGAPENNFFLFRDSLLSFLNDQLLDSYPE